MGDCRTLYKITVEAYGEQRVIETVTFRGQTAHHRIDGVRDQAVAIGNTVLSVLDEMQREAKAEQ